MELNWTEIYNKHYKTTLGYANKMLNYTDSFLAEDLAMKAFLNAMEKESQFDPEKSQIGTWIIAILKNELLLHKKKNKHYTAMPETFDASSDDPNMEEMFIEEEMNEEQLMDYKKMLDAIDSCTSKNKEIFYRVQAGESYPSIAKDLGMAEVSVRGAMKRFMDDVREKLGVQAKMRGKKTLNNKPKVRAQHRGKINTKVEKNIYQNGNRFSLYMNNKYQGSFSSIEEAVEKRNKLNDEKSAKA